MKWKLLLGIVISAVFLYFAFRSVDPGDMAEAFRKADYRYAIPAACLSLLSALFRAMRWKYLLRPVKNIGLSSLFSATAIGLMANGVLPARLGEFIRAYVIGRRENISKSSAFATVVVERIFDGMTVLLFFVIILVKPSFHFSDWLQRVIYMAFAFYFLALGFIIFLRLRTGPTSRFVAFLLKPFPEKAKELVTRLMHSFIDGLAIVKSGRNVLMASLFSFLVWLPNVVIIYILSHSFGIALPVSGAFLMLAIYTFGMMIPSAPGFVGTIQYFSVLGLSIFGVVRASALSFSVVYHLCTFIPIIIAGFICLFVDGYSLVELRQSAGGKRAG